MIVSIYNEFNNPIEEHLTYQIMLTYHLPVHLCLKTGLGTVLSAGENRDEHNFLPVLMDYEQLET